MVDKDFKNLPGRAVFEKVLRNKVSNIPKNLKYHGYQRDITSIIHTYFEKNPLVLLFLIILKANN